MEGRCGLRPGPRCAHILRFTPPRMWPHLAGVQAPRPPCLRVARKKPAAPAAPGPSSAREAAHYILNQVRATVDNVGDEEVRRFIELMRAARSVIVFGRGRSGFAGRGFVVRLMHLGVPAYF